MAGKNVFQFKMSTFIRSGGGSNLKSDFRDPDQAPLTDLSLSTSLYAMAHMSVYFIYSIDMRGTNFK